MDFWNSPETYAAIERAQYFESEGNKRTFDTELESVYLVGHFAIKSETPYGNGEHGVIYTDGPFVLEELPHQYSLTTDLGCQGLPFFAGSIQLGADGCNKSERRRFMVMAVRLTSGCDCYAIINYGQEVAPFHGNPMKQIFQTFSNKERI